MKDLQMSQGDIALEGGDLVIVAGDDELMQAVHTSLQMLAGEWFLDTTAGLRFFEAIHGKQDPGVPRAEVRRALMAIEGVEEVVDLSVQVDGASRTMRVQATITDTTGDTQSVDEEVSV